MREWERPAHGVLEGLPVHRPEQRLRPGAPDEPDRGAAGAWRARGASGRRALRASPS